jgi:hypothetical protein
MEPVVAIDAPFLALLLDPPSRRLAGAGAEWIERLIARWSADRTLVIVPTPALARVLDHAAEAGQIYMELLRRSACFQIRPFDDKAAIELAELGTVDGTEPGMRDILNFDRQIVAIARVSGAAVLYADTARVAAFATVCGLPVRRFKDLAPIERGALRSNR